MGYIYTQGGQLCCDACNASERVRKVPCPHGWCQPAALCPACREKYKDKLTKAAHAHCKEASDAAKAREAKERALFAAGSLVRWSARNDDDRPGWVRVLFRARPDTLDAVPFIMRAETYRAVPLLDPAAPEDYARHGQVINLDTGTEVRIVAQQLDFFKAPEPVFEQPVFILSDNTLALAPPSLRPAGPESAERRAARLREIEGRKAVTA